MSGSGVHLPPEVDTAVNKMKEEFHQGIQTAKTGIETVKTGISTGMNNLKAQLDDPKNAQAVQAAKVAAIAGGSAVAATALTEAVIAGVKAGKHKKHSTTTTTQKVDYYHCTCPHGTASKQFHCTSEGAVLCQSCSSGYTLNGKQHCQANQCKCPHGTAVVRDACTSDGAILCQSCSAGYSLSGGSCQANRCSCPKGSPATGAACISDGMKLCQSCSKGYTLKGFSCQANICKCSHGIPASGSACISDDYSICASCLPGYVAGTPDPHGLTRTCHKAAPAADFPIYAKDMAPEAKLGAPETKGDDLRPLAFWIGISIAIIGGICMFAGIAVFAWKKRTSFQPLADDGEDTRTLSRFSRPLSEVSDQAEDFSRESAQTEQSEDLENIAIDEEYQQDARNPRMGLPVE
jgi:hypothetical protein